MFLFIVGKTYICLSIMDMPVIIVIVDNILEIAIMTMYALNMYGFSQQLEIVNPSSSSEQHYS